MRTGVVAGDSVAGLGAHRWCTDVLWSGIVSCNTDGVHREGKLPVLFTFAG
jgi:hypothetical protein